MASAEYHREWRKRQLEEYDNLLIRQANRCGICHTHISMLRGHFDIDHDHSTGKIRGLLCNKCNQAIGLLGDSLVRVQEAMTYLEGNNG